MISITAPITPAAVTKEKLNWRQPNCGGIAVHGSKECVLIETSGKYICFCLNKPKGIDYEICYHLAQAVYVNKLHLNNSGEAWDKVTFDLFSTGKFKLYLQVQSKTLTERFFSTMIKEVSSRHSLGDAAGREAHPDITPYDELMLKMIKAIENKAALKKLENEKKLKKESSMLSHEKDICPVINFTKQTSKVFNQEGVEIMNELEELQTFCMT